MYSPGRRWMWVTEALERKPFCPDPHTCWAVLRIYAGFVPFMSLKRARFVVRWDKNVYRLFVKKYFLSIILLNLLIIFSVLSEGIFLIPIMITVTMRSWPRKYRTVWLQSKGVKSIYFLHQKRGYLCGSSWISWPAIFFIPALKIRILCPFFLIALCTRSSVPFHLCIYIPT